MLMSAGMTTRTRRPRDLDELVNYREHEGLWSGFFEENWLKPKLRALGYTHVRFFSGTICDYNGSYRERACELKREGMPVEYRLYG